MSYAKPEIGDNAMARLSGLAEEQQKAEQYVLDAEEALKVAKANLRFIQEEALPELMDELGLQEFKTSEGLKIKVALDVKTSITKEKNDEAMDFLDNAGHGGLIKREVSVRFSREFEEEAEELAKRLSHDYDIEVKRKVEPMTLKSFVKKALEAGEEIPVDLFGVHIRRVSKIEKS